MDRLLRKLAFGSVVASLRWSHLSGLAASAVDVRRPRHLGSLAADLCSITFSSWSQALFGRWKHVLVACDLRLERHLTPHALSPQSNVSQEIISFVLDDVLDQ